MGRVRLPAGGAPVRPATAGGGVTPAAPASGAAPLPERIVIGSRKSRLARVQAERVGRRIREAWPVIRVEYAALTSRGDRLRHRPLPEVGGKGLFTEALERALLAGEIDLAVHSLKDLPSWGTEGLALLAVPEREDPRDVLVSRHGVGPEGLSPGTVVGTSSLRRKALLLRRRPDCGVRDVRGNVETRLRKLAEGKYGALLLAAAGLERLGIREGTAAPAIVPLDPEEWPPAPGQGALAVQGREDDEAVRGAAERLDDLAVRATVTAERGFLAALEGGCRVPIGAYAILQGEEIVLRGIVLTPDGREALEGVSRGPAGRPLAVGRELAEEMRGRGVERLLAEARS